MEPKRVEAIYELIGKYSIELPSDAWVLGPKHIHELIGLTRGYINSVTLILQEILQERQSLDRAKHAAETLYRVEADRLLATDDRVRKAPNIEDRKSNINLILRERLTEISNLEGQLLDLSYVEKVVRHRYNELKATMTDIRAQRALIRDAIDSGSFYGDETETSRGSRNHPAPSNSGFSEEEIDRSMSELNDMLLTGSTEPEESQEPASPPVAAAPEALPPEPTPEVKAPPPEAPKSSVDDFSDLIDGIESGETPEEVTESSPDPETPEDPALSNFLDGDDLSNLFDE